MAAVVGLVAFGLWLWRLGRSGGADLMPADAPSWATFTDYLLSGPDAGAWASNATALHLGRLVDLDAHRMPTLPYLTAAVMNVVPDVALAGHLLNHLLHLAMPLAVYVVGARIMGRGMAVGAAAAAAMYSPLVLSSYRYGVDSTVTTMMPLAFLAAVVVGRWWWLAPVGGVVVAAATACHLTTLGVFLPATFLCLMVGQPGWRRWIGAIAMLATAAGTVWYVFQTYPHLPWGIFTSSLAEGVTPASASGGVEGRLADSSAAIAVIRAGATNAATEVVAWLARNARPRWVPWRVAVVLPWLGLLGLGLAVEPGDERPKPRWVPRRVWLLGRELAGVGPGLAILAMMAPVLAFAAAHSPSRYTDNFYPIGVLLLFRGGAVLTHAIDRFAVRRWPEWPTEVVGLFVGLACVLGLWDPATLSQHVRLPPLREDIAAWRLGHAISQHFPPGGGGSCPEREAVAYAGRSYCPATVCPSPPVPHVEDCLGVLRKECSGDGPIPYVVVVKKARDERQDSRKELDAWVQAGFPLVETVDDPLYTAQIYGIPREDAPAAP